jgi:hypothetical protein
MAGSLAPPAEFIGGAFSAATSGPSFVAGGRPDRKRTSPLQPRAGAFGASTDILVGEDQAFRWRAMKPRQRLVGSSPSSRS